MYIYIIYSLILICVITLFDVRTKLNNHIIQFYDLKYTYEIEALKIDCHILKSSNVLFSDCNRI